MIEMLARAETNRRTDTEEREGRKEERGRSNGGQEEG
jgi:hypothetical protein